MNPKLASGIQESVLSGTEGVYCNTNFDVGVNLLLTYFLSVGHLSCLFVNLCHIDKSFSSLEPVCTCSLHARSDADDTIH